MAFSKTPDYLWRKNADAVWHFKMGIPAALRKHYPSDTPGKTKTHVVQSLHTYSRPEAQKLVLPLAAQQMVEFKRLSSGVVTKAINPAHSRVPDIRQSMAQLLADGPSGEDDVTALVLYDAIEHTSEQIRKEAGNVAADFAVRRMAQPNKVSLNEALTAFVGVSDSRAQTIGTYHLAVREFLGFLQVPDCFPEDVTDAKAVAYVDMLNAGPLSKSAKSKRLVGLHQVWLHMRRKGWPHSPWTDHKLTTPAKAPKVPQDESGVDAAEKGGDDEDNEDVRPFTDAEAIKVFTLPEPKDKRQRTYTRPLFRELYALGFITGMRLNEIVSLRPMDVSVLDEDWRLVTVPKGVAKTEAGIRRIPVCHPVAVAILDARLKQQEHPKGRLYAECNPGGPDNKPSWHVSKAMSKERLDGKRLGFTSEVNFHSTRRSFSTLLEQKSLAEPIAQQRYIGHAIPSLMHTVYSGGSGIEKLKKVVEELSYSPALEEALSLAVKR
ncbi:MAG: hypothetical protein QM749_01665 [Aquabacterium sp.]